MSKFLFTTCPDYVATIGVMGSASGHIMRNTKAIKASHEIGAAIAKNKCVLVNGACPGLPDKAAIGAKEAGGETMGISPAISMCSHVKKYKSPVDHYDRFVFTGMGLMMRDIINIRSSNAVIILPGGTGTLNEFTVAFDEGKPIGVLEGFGGCAEHIRDILKFCHRSVTDRLIFSKNPTELVSRLIALTHEIESGCTLDDYLIGDGGEVTKIEQQILDTDTPKTTN